MSDRKHYRKKAGMGMVREQLEISNEIHGATEMFAPCSRAALERLSETDRIIILEEQVKQEITGFPTSSGQRAALPSRRVH